MRTWKGSTLTSCAPPGKAAKKTRWRASRRPCEPRCPPRSSKRSATARRWPTDRVAPCSSYASTACGRSKISTDQARRTITASPLGVKILTFAGAREQIDCGGPMSAKHAVQFPIPAWSGLGRRAVRWVLVAVLFAPLAACGDASVEQPPTGTLEQALVGAPAKRTRTIAAMMFDIGQGPPDQAKIQTLLTGDMQSLRHMYNEISFGMQDLSVDLLGPYTLPQPTCLPIECCGPKPSQPNGPQVAAPHAMLPKKQ